MPKTVDEYQTDEQIRLCAEAEREKSNKLYAIKIVETIVFGMVGLILTAVCVALIALVVSNGGK